MCDSDRLEFERQMFGNRDGCQEIIEEYNEEEEKKWREQHKTRVREHKLAEAEERKRLQRESNINIDTILGEAELVEELESELQQLSLEDDFSSSFEQHVCMDNKEAIHPTHEEAGPSIQLQQNVIDSDDDDDAIGTKEFISLQTQASNLTNEEKIEFYEIHLKQIEAFFKQTTCTIHNFGIFADKRVTEENLKNAIAELEEYLDQDADERANDNQLEVQPNDAPQLYPNPDHSQPSVNLAQRKYQSPAEYDEVEVAYKTKTKSELLVFYKSQLRNVMKSIAGCSLDIHAREQKRILYEYLTERIANLRMEIQAEKQIKFEEDFVDDDDGDLSGKKQSRCFDPNNTDYDYDDGKEDDPTGKRRISFASQPVTVTFFEDDEPCVVRISE